jgi:uncharacterized protein YjbI with pentapeptide repeats
VLTGTGAVYLTYDGLTRNADAAGTFALYRQTATGEGLLQAVGETAATKFGNRPPVFLTLDDVRHPAQDDVYPRARCSTLGTSFRYERQGDGRMRFALPSYKAVLSARESRLWLLNERSMFESSARWDVTVVTELALDSSKKDLRWLQFPKGVLTTAILNETRFEYAELKEAALLFCKMKGAKLGNASLFRASFSSAPFVPAANDFAETDLSGASFKEAAMLGTRFDGCNLTGADFTSANLSLSVLGPGYVAAFSRANLTAATFSAGIDLTDVDFSGAKLIGTTLAGTTLIRAKFNKADLTGANLSGANLAGADFSGAILLRTNFAGATFDTDTNFTGARMMGADFSNTDLTKPKFSNPPAFCEGTLEPPTPASPRTRLRGTTLELALIGMDWRWLDLTGAKIAAPLGMNLTGFQADYAIFPAAYDLKGRTLDDARFYYTTMVGVDLQGAKAASNKPPDFTRADLTGASMSGVKLKGGANFTEAWLTGVKLANSALDGAIFKSAHLETKDDKTADLSFSTLMDATFENAFLSGANLSYVLLWGDKAKITGATAEGTNFANAYLANLDFQNVAQQKLTSSTFSGACLVNANFCGTALTRVSLTGACLQGAKFTDAKLDGAQMTNAAVWMSDTPGVLTLSGHLSLPDQITFSRTEITPSATTSQTTCPSGAVGPCDGARWDGRDAPMTKWTWGSKLREE